ncbi:hypothetical protein E9993_12485 [Labilibacter sediminis]|nr:hypothetical protein E9993_12485 [Labilibacter sediminis]
MTLKFQNKYRIESIRLQNWDYKSNAAYFITICTQNRHPYFGNIVTPTQLSPIGKIVETEWLKTPQLRPDMNLELDAYVVMPNHFHGIIIIGENKYNGGGDGVMGGRDTMHRVSTGNQHNSNHFGPQRKNLASIIRGFKSAVTMNARKINPDFAWQSRFWEHIIRDDDSYQRIKQYIIDNPDNWEGDRLKQ